MKTTFIYALKELSPGEFFSTKIRYIGKSDDPYERFEEHCKTKEKNHRGNWMRSLPVNGLSPQLEILDEVPFEHWQQCEVAYIEFFREQGCELTNGTPGGEDPPAGVGEKNHNFGKTHTLAALEKNRLAHLGKKLTLESVAKRTAKQRGVKKSNNTSGVAGVCFDKSREKWKASLMVAHREIQLGRFKNFEDAVFVRRLAEAKYFS